MVVKSEWIDLNTYKEIVKQGNPKLKVMVQNEILYRGLYDKFVFP